MELFGTDELYFTPIGKAFSGKEKIFFRTASVREIGIYNRAEQALLDRYKDVEPIRDRLIRKGWTEEEHDSFLRVDFSKIPEGEEGEKERADYLKRLDEYRREKSVADMPTEEDHEHKIVISLRCIERLEGFTLAGEALDWSDDECWMRVAKKAKLEDVSPRAGRRFLLEKLGAGQDLHINLTTLAGRIVTGITESEGND